ncbi:DUF1302 domain-containing protein [Duganella sp. BJB1802]|uniref:DUF1302 domain-containing protein n=1 Tax=Duganella sp. BJB1802 TaxID=2744575 RepID=UPI001593AECE|nr:DUF1302 domain-containing protein [Duganella sp. BJB1802]NVD69599.1 DUF1302 domain-containing protein [Duganella sp. BJB1802]
MHRSPTQPNTPRIAILCAIVLAWSYASAADIETGNPDLKLRWDTTLKYSAATRLRDANPSLIGPADANLNDGDRNFRTKGLVSNRIDIFTEADIVYQERLGARISAAGWYDTVYNRANKNDSAFTVNSASVPANEFTGATRDLMGRKAELLDAFVFGSTDIGDMRGTFRLGKHAQLWGETLFFGANGIAGGMAPIDLIKLLTVPGSQFKEVMRPVNQASAQLQVLPGVTVGAYYQFEWEANRIPAVGAYSSFVDVFGAGRERLLWPTGAYFASAPDIKPSDRGQYGLQLRLRPSDMDADIGLYAIRYHQKDPNLYIRPFAGQSFFGNQGMPGQQVGDFALAYHEGTRAYGASLSTTVGSANVGLEASLRENAALVNPDAFVFGPGADNRANPAYPIGRSAHLNASMIQLLSPTPLWEGGSFLAEVAWNRLLSITSNPQVLEVNAARDALGFRMLFTPTYYQVRDGLDVSVPVGLGYNPKGRSSVVSLFNGGVDKGGDFSVGITGNYQKKLTFGLTLTTYFGSMGAALDGPNLSFKQYYKDRSNLAANVQMSF